MSPRRTRSGSALPAGARWLLRMAVPPDERDAIEGDLLETAEAERRGRVWLLGQVAAMALWFGASRFLRGPRAVRASKAPTVVGILNGRGVDMEGWWRDLRISARALGRRPGFTAIVTMTLALGIGANTAIFSVLRSAVLFELPYEDPDRVLWHSDGRRDSGRWGSSMSIPNIVDLREQATTLAGLEAYWYRGVNVASEERPERVMSLAVGPDFLSVLGVPPALGRDFTADDNVDGASPVAIVGHDLWRDRFGSDPDVVGRTVLLDATPHTVIGVLPAAFEFRSDPRVLTSLQYEGRELSRRGRGYNAVSRLAAGATVEAAQAEVAEIFRRLEEAYPDANEGWTTFAHPIRDFMVPESTRRSLRILSGAVLLVLLIACVNVANLLLVRSESRQRELAVRVAMGAGRGRLLPVFLSESLLLALLGGGLGLVLAWTAVPALAVLFGDTIPRADTVGVDRSVLGFALGLSVLTGTFVGALPALRANLRELAGQLREGTRSVSRTGHRIRHALVVVEVALSVVLVAAAGLFLKSFWQLGRIDPGLEKPEQVLVAHLVLSPGAYEGPASWDAFFDELVTSIEALPGVVAAGTTSRLPLHGGYNVTDMFAAGDRERVSHFVELRYVSTGFFDAVGIDVVAGRALEANDGDARGNVVATEELARQLFGSAQAAVGEAIIAGHWEHPVRIVGVVSDVRDLGLLRAAPPGIYYVYGPETNHGYGGILTVRTAGDPMDVLPRVRDVVYRLDPTVPLYDIRLLSDVVARTVGTQRFSTVLFGLFAGLALVLGAVGIYGVVAYMVSERTREMGVRMALGARAREVVQMVLRSGVRLTALGLVIGIGVALATGRLLTDLLYEVDPGDPLVHGTVAALLLGVGVVACWVPAWRASRVDPVQALRHE